MRNATGKGGASREESGMQDEHTVILGVREGILIDLALSGLQGAGVRASRGAARPADAGLVNVCGEILRDIEQARSDRQQIKLAMIATTMEPAAA
jgi:hypothetical protein